MKPVVKRVVVALLLLTAGGLALRWHLSRTTEAVNGELTLYGNMEIRTANLAFTESERIAAVLVHEGEPVVAGQVLAKLRTDLLEAQIREIKAQIGAQQEVVKGLQAGSRPQTIEQARAEVAAAKAQVINARNIYDRIRKTSGAGATSAQTLDDARSKLDMFRSQLRAREMALALAVEGPRKEDIAAAQNTLEGLNAKYELMKLRLGDMTLKAPEAGIIQNRILEPGELAAPSRPVITLALTNPKWVRAYVAEPDLGKVHPDQKAKVVGDSFPDQAFEGWVGFISPVAEFTPKSVETEDLRTQLVYEVRIYVKDPQDQLRLGMPVTVTLLPVSDQAAAGKE